MTSNAKIKEAVRGLDPDDDSLWTLSGHPTVHAVAEATDDHTLTREDIDAASGNWDREVARAAKAKPSQKDELEPNDGGYTGAKEATQAPALEPIAVKAVRPFPGVHPENGALVIALTETGPAIVQYRNEATDTMTSKHGGFFSKQGAGGYTVLEGKVTGWAEMPNLTA